MEVNRRRDERIRDALDRYQREYYSQSTALLEEWKKERAALSERIRADESARGNQAAYSDEARSIGKEYRQESRVLRKDHSGKYWKEITDAREEARDLRQAVQELKAEDVAQLNLEIGQDCKKSAKARLRNVFEWVAGRMGKNKPEDRSEPPYGATGRRG
ncbi:MAG: hypothetical protein J0L97_01820 [Alphaproteobacteria bacterium]|nr:hypothetical protein [Alphaproteobacteria bacterium]